MYRGVVAEVVGGYGEAECSVDLGVLFLLGVGGVGVLVVPQGARVGRLWYYSRGMGAAGVLGGVIC